MALFDFNNRLNLTTDGFTQHVHIFHRPRVRWRDIRRALGVKRDLLTYVDSLIVFETASGQVGVSDSNRQFPLFEAALLQHLPDFPADWYEQIETIPFNSPIVLWERR